MGPIAFIGNMNNSFFSIVRHMRDRGHDAHLLCTNREDTHFRPAADSLTEDYLSYTNVLSWGSVGSLVKVRAAEIRRDLEPYSRLIGCGAVPAFVEKAGLVLDMMIPYGSDIYSLPFFPIPALRKPLKRRSELYLWRLQRRGIARAKWIQQINVFGGRRQSLLKALGVEDRLFYAPVPAIYDYFSSIDDEHPIWKHPVLKRVIELRQNTDFLVFHHNRHIWGKGSDKFARKGNDVFIRGFADFCRSSDGPSAPLAVLMEYGAGVNDSKALIKALGVEDRTIWLAATERRLLFPMLGLADVGIGQFDQGNYINGVVLEILAAGKPLIHHFRGDRHGQTGLPPYPYMEANSPEAVASALSSLWHNREKRTRLGCEAKQWYREKVIDRSLCEYESRLGLRA